MVNKKYEITYEDLIELDSVENYSAEGHAPIPSDLIFRFMKQWKLRLVEQDMYGLIMILRGFSCMIMKEKIMCMYPHDDLRLPFIFISKPGTGKSEGLDIYNQFFGKFIDIQTPSHPTTQRMVGSIDENKVKLNNKKGLQPSDDGYKNPEIPGYLQVTNDLILDEANHFFDKSEDSRTKIQKIREALNRYGSKTNQIGSDTLKNQENIKKHSICNVAFLLYDDDKLDLDKEIVNNGLFQRCIFFKKQTEDKFFLEIERNRPTISRYEEQEQEKIITKIGKFSKYLELIREKGLFMEPEGHQKVREFHQKLNKKTLELDNTEKESLFVFNERYKRLTVKISGIIAILRNFELFMKTNEMKPFHIREIDTVLGIELMKKIWIGIKSHIVKELGYNELKEDYHLFKKHFSSKKMYKTKEVQKIIQKIWGCSLSKVKKQKYRYEKFFREVAPPSESTDSRCKFYEFNPDVAVLEEREEEEII